MMCETPSNTLLVDQFLDYFDGSSIGLNDLTQLTLGLDRDSGLIAQWLMKETMPLGQGPSDHPDLAEWLMEEIESISLNPDSIIGTWFYLTKQCH